jgi:hypothetical protein
MQPIETKEYSKGKNENSTFRNGKKEIQYLD